MDEHFDLRQLPEAPTVDAPWYFRLGRALARRNIRGGARLLSEARRFGLLDKLALYTVGDVALRVPLWRPCNAWDEVDIQAYEARFMDALGDAVRALPGEATLLDCGADIGTVTAHLVARCKNIKDVIAFEPNAAAYDVLAENLHFMPLRAEARHAAVGSFTGKGRLMSPEHDKSAHAMYIEPYDSGDIAVQRIDDLALPAGSSVVIKIDVEGSEVAVVEGALRTIRDASACIVAFEAHPLVAERCGDPSNVMRALRSVRSDFTFTVDKVPSLVLDPNRPVFEQIQPSTVYNVIGTSVSRPT